MNDYLYWKRELALTFGRLSEFINHNSYPYRLSIKAAVKDAKKIRPSMRWGTKRPTVKGCKRKAMS